MLRRCARVSPLLTPGDSWCTRGVLPLTILVGISKGRFFSHKHVAFVSPCPNCHGWISWVRLPIAAASTPLGFSIPTRGTCWQATVQRFAVHDFAWSLSLCLAQPIPYVPLPERQRAVQDGNRIAMSHR